MLDASSRSTVSVCKVMLESALSILNTVQRAGLRGRNHPMRLKKEKERTADGGGGAATSVNDGAGPSNPAAAKPKQRKPVDMQELELKMNHAAVGVHAALGYAGYPPQLIEKLMGTENFCMRTHLSVEYENQRKYSWSVKLPHKPRIGTFVGILRNPCPGGTVAANPVCHTLGCDKPIGHLGHCRVAYSARYKVKPGLGEGMPFTIRLETAPSLPPAKNPQSTLSSSSDEDELKEDGAANPLLPTEDERDGDEEGEDPYSSLDED